MSNQFNYELDERHIRILMQNAELKYDESAWQKFQAIPVIEQRQSIGIALPKINFGISRSVIVPIFFVLMIGGLSALLFSFVDFKKKEEVIKEIPYIAPVVSKKSTTPTPVIKKDIVVIPTKNDSLTPVITSTVAQTKETSTVALVAEKTPLIVEPAKSEEKITPKKEKKETFIVKKENHETTQPTVKKKKKRRKQITEELPTINASSTNLNEGSKEPELDIK
jgi:hypothetical protein